MAENKAGTSNRGPMSHTSSGILLYSASIRQQFNIFINLTTIHWIYTELFKVMHILSILVNGQRLLSIYCIFLLVMLRPFVDGIQHLVLIYALHLPEKFD